jgi:hypothetical protein
VGLVPLLTTALVPMLPERRTGRGLEKNFT